MARPKVEFPPVEAIRLLLDAEGRLAVKVTPGARVQALEIGDGRLFAKVRAKPTDGEANEAVRSLLAEALDIAPSRVTLARGAASRDKLFHIDH